MGPDIFVGPDCAKNMRTCRYVVSNSFQLRRPPQLHCGLKEGDFWQLLCLTEQWQRIKQNSRKLLPKILNGGIAGIVGVACTFPLDLVKTRLQKQTVGPGGRKLYNSIFDAFSKIYVSEGLRGMYRGAGVLILLVTPEKAVKLAANDYFRFHLKDENNKISGFRQGLAGALTDPTGGKSMIPTISATKITTDIIKNKGIRGLYKGLVATWARDIPFCMVYFPLFAKIDSLGPRKANESGDAKFYWSFLGGLAAGATSAFIMTPFDVMKTRIQSVTKSAQGDKTYSGVWDAFRDILKNEGITAFFKGGACRIIVIAPLYAIVQGVYFMGVAEKLLGIEKDSKITKKS
ncbi:hypothetical protein D910_00830 [Dendroctonus ponderosae]|uniref:Uncharacterized protein n=1 Tax=Dendroctonus ponderosae TaxID=77166 RepID=U4TUQ1_DENPD|nr:hypothetical protein D910_00501 [Dendroctonus ponderosae]ERL83663.1 hypothetical protein D910_00830 [Dendroctonus ponderosae]